MELIDYLNTHFLTQAQLLALAGIDTAVLEDLQRRRMLPLPSYRLRLNATCHSFFGEHAVQAAPDYYPKGCPAWIAALSSCVMIPCCASMALCAREPWMSWEARRLSKPMEALMASMSALGIDEKRPPHMVFAEGFAVLSDTVFHPMDLLGLPLPHLRAAGQPARVEGGSKCPARKHA